MLVLRRVKGEAICIGEDIRIRILHFTHRKVSLGIEAPPEVKILREELVGTGDAARPTTEKAACP